METTETTEPLSAGDWLRATAPEEIRDLIYEEDKNKIKKGLLSDSEWSWEEDAMTMIAQFYGEECAENFNTSYTYSIRHTNNCIGDKSLEGKTELLREALHNYVRNVLQLNWKDDFDYNMMNYILPIVVKVYLKKIVCFPERMTRSNFEWVKQQQGYSTFDMTQLAMIGAETRRVSSMVHVTRAMKLYLRS
jgi:sestrin